MRLPINEGIIFLQQLIYQLKIVADFANFMFPPLSICCYCNYNSLFPFFTIDFATNAEILFKNQLWVFMVPK